LAIYARADAIVLEILEPGPVDSKGKAVIYIDSDPEDVVRSESGMDVHLRASILKSPTDSSTRRAVLKSVDKKVGSVGSHPGSVEEAAPTILGFSGEILSVGGWNSLRGEGAWLNTEAMVCIGELINLRSGATDWEPGKPPPNAVCFSTHLFTSIERDMDSLRDEGTLFKLHYKKHVSLCIQL
jgi:hypothetical protein